MLHDRPSRDGSIDEIGTENVCFETDYPHTDTSWPFTKDIAQELVANLRRAAYKVLHGNAIRMLELDRVSRGRRPWRQNSQVSSAVTCTSARWSASRFPSQLYITVCCMRATACRVSLDLDRAEARDRSIEQVHEHAVDRRHRGLDAVGMRRR